MKKFYFFLLKTDHFCGFNAFLNKKKLKGKFSNNLGRNICRRSHFFAQFLFTTSETELNYCHQKVNVRVASQVAERLKTQLRWHGIFAAGGAFAPTQEKKNLASLGHVHRWAGLSTHTRKKKLRFLGNQEILRKSLKCLDLIACTQSSTEKPNFGNFW